MSSVGLGRPGNNGGAGGLTARAGQGSRLHLRVSRASPKIWSRRALRRGYSRANRGPRSFSSQRWTSRNSRPGSRRPWSRATRRRSQLSDHVQAMRLAKCPEEPPGAMVSMSLPPQTHQPRNGPHAGHQRGHDQQSQQHVVVACRPSAAEAIAEALAAACSASKMYERCAWACGAAETYPKTGLGPIRPRVILGVLG